MSLKRAASTAATGRAVRTKTDAPDARADAVDIDAADTAMLTSTAAAAAPDAGVEAGGGTGAVTVAVGGESGAPATISAPLVIVIDAAAVAAAASLPLPPALAAGSSVVSDAAKAPESAPVAAPAVPVVVYIGRNPHNTDDDDNDEPISAPTDTTAMVDAYHVAVREATVQANRRGGVKVINPDLALHINSVINKKNIFCLELTDHARVHITRSESKNTSSTGAKTGSGVYFVNLLTKRTQTFDAAAEMANAVAFQGYRMQTVFAVPIYLAHGQTKESGVEGNHGRMIKGTAVNLGSEQYQLGLTNKTWLQSMSNKDDNNPMSDAMFDHWNALALSLLTRIFGIKDALKSMREKMVTSNRGAALSSDSAVLAADAITMKLFSAKVKTSNAGDTTSRELMLGTSCFRPLKVRWIGGTPAWREDVSKYVPPSDLFVSYQHKTGTQIRLVHNNIPLFRCRRHDEVEEGKTYDSPYILVPQANAQLDSSDVISVVYTMKFYEEKQNVCGFTNKPIAFIWLNKFDVLRTIKDIDVVPVNPLYAVPMAGHYLGPLGYEGKPPSKLPAA